MRNFDFITQFITSHIHKQTSNIRYFFLHSQFTLVLVAFGDRKMHEMHSHLYLEREHASEELFPQSNMDSNT